MPIPSCIGTYINVLSHNLITTGYSIIFSCRVRLSTTHHRTKDASDGIHLHTANAASVRSQVSIQSGLIFDLPQPPTPALTDLIYIPSSPKKSKAFQRIPKAASPLCLTSGVIHAPFTLHQNCHSCQSVSFQEAGAYYLYAGLISKSFPYTFSFPHYNKS